MKTEIEGHCTCCNVATDNKANVKGQIIHICPTCEEFVAPFNP